MTLGKRGAIWLRHDLSVRRLFFMQDRASVASSSGSQQSISSSGTAGKHREGRGAWVLTAYGVSGLALFGVLAYFFSDFIAH
jgi:hypothetical protein